MLRVKQGTDMNFCPCGAYVWWEKDKKQGECVLLDGDQVLGEKSELGQGGKCWQYASGK